MTPEQAKYLIPIVQAIADGKVIQRRHRLRDPEDDEWYTPVTMVALEPDYYEYRIKPERRKVWVHFNNDGVPFVCRDDNEHFRCTAGCKVVCVEEPE